MMRIASDALSDADGASGTRGSKCKRYAVKSENDMPDYRHQNEQARAQHACAVHKEALSSRRRNVRVRISSTII